MGKIKNKSSNYKIIDDWADFDKSKIMSLSAEYYGEKGIDAFSRVKSSNIIPSETSCSYAHAESLALLLKNQMDINPDKKLFKVLELGVGSGLFSYNFLRASEKLGIIDKVNYCVSDFNENILVKIKDLEFLNQFENNVNFQVIDLLNIDNSYSLTNADYQLDDLDLVVGNYLMDVFPALPVKFSNKNIGELEKLQIKISQPKNLLDDDLYSNDALFKNLKIEERYVAYNSNGLSDLEARYIDLFEAYIRKNDSRVPRIYPYGYGSLKALESVVTRLSDEGLFYIMDVPYRENANIKPYDTYGNTVANHVNFDLMICLLEQNGNSFRYTRNDYYGRLLVARNDKLLFDFSEEFEFIEDFMANNPINLYSDLIRAISMIKTREGVPVLGTLIDSLEKISPNETTTHLIRADYHTIKKDYANALSFLNLAKEADKAGMYKVNTEISKIKSLMK